MLSVPFLMSESVCSIQALFGSQFTRGGGGGTLTGCSFDVDIPVISVASKLVWR